MAAITVSSTVPAVAVLVEQAVIEKIDELADRAHLIPIESSETKAAADVLYAEIRSISKAIEAQREVLKRPALDYGRQVDNAAKGAQDILKPTLDALGKRIQTYIDAENAKILAEQRKREEEARARQAEEEAKAAAAAAFAGDGAEAAAEHLPARIPDPPAPVFMKSTAVQRTVRKVLRITDATKIPREIGGVSLWLVDEKAVEKFLRASVAIPGAELVDEVSIGAKGTR